MRWLCDEMLARLARLLRAAGEDVQLCPSGTKDADLLALAQAEDRLLVTRDRRLAAAAGAQGLLVRSDATARQAVELGRQVGIEWQGRRFTRCLVDNTPLRAASPEEIAALPGDTRERPGPFRVCPDCGRRYWPGSHVRRLNLRLDQIAAESAGDRLQSL